jgi:hypothetical protein
MIMIGRLLFALALAVALLSPAGVDARVPPAQVMPAKVIVLVTLHRMHETVPGYSFDRLGRIIEHLKPDVLCVELQPEDLTARPDESTKREYPKVIYPLIDRHHYRVYALEPAEPTYSAIIKPYVAGAQAFQQEQPSMASAFGQYSKGLYAGLTAYWTSPARINDATTDAQLRAKHALQQAMMGAAERTGWQRWNGEFLATITRAARENPGKRIVVTVGAEHGYWLRGHLADVPGLKLLDTAALLGAMRLHPAAGQR